MGRHKHVGLTAALLHRQQFGGQTGQMLWWGEKKKTEKWEKYHLPELRGIIICSSHNDLQYYDRNGSHFKITE